MESGDAKFQTLSSDYEVSESPLVTSRMHVESRSDNLSSVAGGTEDASLNQEQLRANIVDR
jgi:hypothetical protein